MPNLVTSVAEEEISSTSRGSPSWPKNHIDMRHINRRKNPKFFYITNGEAIDMGSKAREIEVYLLS